MSTCTIIFQVGDKKTVCENTPVRITLNEFISLIKSRLGLNTDYRYIYGEKELDLTNATAFSKQAQFITATPNLIHVVEGEADDGGDDDDDNGSNDGDYNLDDGSADAGASGCDFGWA